MMRLKRLLRRKFRPNVAAQTPNQPPAQEDESHHDPPPYSASSATQTDQNGGGAPQAIASTPQETAMSGLLDPNLNFTAAQMEQQWRAKDKAFARAVVQFVAERFDGNLRGWAGFKYTYINDVLSRIAIILKSILICSKRIRLERNVRGTIFLGTTPGVIVQDSNKWVP
jgi:hypothetical protein